MYYQANIYLSTEELDPDGINPESHQEHGCIQTIKKPTLAELKAEIERQYFKLDKPIGADVQIFDGRIEITYEGEHDYRTPTKDRVPFMETMSIVISKIEETVIDLETEELFKGIAR